MMEWNATWETGNSVIDSQHKQLFLQLKKLTMAIAAGKGDGETERALMLMGEYVETHFRDEERLMRESGYGGINRHMAIHVAMGNQVHSLIQNFLENHQPIPETVLAFLGGWLKEHLDGEDRMLAVHLRESNEWMKQETPAPDSFNWPHPGSAAALALDCRCPNCVRLEESQVVAENDPPFPH